VCGEEEGSTSGGNECSMVAASGGQRTPSPHQVIQDGAQPHLAPLVDQLICDGNALEIVWASPACHRRWVVL
jgi:hypothetical protein